MHEWIHTHFFTLQNLYQFLTCLNEIYTEIIKCTILLGQNKLILETSPTFIRIKSIAAAVMGFFGVYNTTS